MVVELTASIPEAGLAFLIVFMPALILMGAKGIADWIEGFMKIRRGFFFVSWVMKNHQWRTKFIKPKANTLEIEGKPQPFINNPKYTAFSGAKKMVFFTRVGDRLKQMMVAPDTDKDIDKNKGIPPENEFNDMLDAAEISGSLLGLRKGDTDKILLFAAIGVGALAVIMGILNMGAIQAITPQIGNLTSMVSNIAGAHLPAGATPLGG